MIPPGDPEPCAARCLEFDPRRSELEVSNDVLRESLRLPPPPSLGTWLQQQAPLWMATLERRQIDALYWLCERKPWQRGALSMGVGALIGLGIVLGTARLFHWERGDVPAPAQDPRAFLLAPLAAPALAPMPAPALAPAAAPALAPMPAPALAPPSQQAAPEQQQARPAPTAQAKPAKKRRSRPRRQARSRARAWAFPLPQRRVR